MERCNKRSLARGIKRTLDHFDKIIVTKKEECDWMMYAFARLYGIGVIPTIDEDLRTEYTFFNNPEVICNFDKMRMGFDSASVNIFWENVDSDLLFRSLHYVTDKLDLRDWRLYLELNDWEPTTSKRAAIPRTRMLDLTTGGPGREALERMMRTNQYVDVASMHPKLSDSILRYCKKDVESVMDLYKGLEEKKNTIKKVIFHDPATIVYWEDGTKTVVKTQGDELYDAEKGLAMAIVKKVFGNEGKYYDIFKKFLPKEEKKTFEFSFDLPEGVEFKPMNLEESGEAPKEVSDCGIEINVALAAFTKDVGCLEALYDPERSMYHIKDKNHFEKAPYALAVDSPIAEISPTALAQLKLDICKYFDI